MAASPARHDNVDFLFLCDNGKENVILQGTMIVRGDEMVLDIPGGYGPYLLIGKTRKSWFEAENTHQNRKSDVDAKWANVDNRFVGFWVEDGCEYLFSFQPNPQDRKAAAKA